MLHWQMYGYYSALGQVSFHSMTLKNPILNLHIWVLVVGRLSLLLLESPSCTKINSPDKILAMAAEGWMFEESWHKLMVLDFVNIFLPQRSFPDLLSGLNTPSSCISGSISVHDHDHFLYFRIELKAFISHISSWSSSFNNLKKGF